MKKFLLFLFALISITTFAYAGENGECPPASPASAELEHIKSLAGTWEGTNPGMDGKPQKGIVEYKVTSGGTAVIETLFPGTPHEMVSVYHDVHGKPAMTHYCMMGNNPEMTLKDSTGGKWLFEMTPEAHKSSAGEAHMHSVMLDDSVPGQLTQVWSSMDKDGKPTPTVTLVFKKAASAAAASASAYPGPHEAGPNIYKKLFENDEVRVSEIKFNPGDKIAMHHHSYGHSIYILEAGQLTISHPDGTSVVVDGKVGDVMWMGVEDHAAVNTGTTTLRALITEVKKSTT